MLSTTEFESCERRVSHASKGGSKRGWERLDDPTMIRWCRFSGFLRRRRDAGPRWISTEWKLLDWDSFVCRFVQGRTAVSLESKDERKYEKLRGSAAKEKKGKKIGNDRCIDETAEQLCPGFYDFETWRIWIFDTKIVNTSSREGRSYFRRFCKVFFEISNCQCADLSTCRNY